MSRIPTTCFSELVALSEAMLGCAEQGDWPQLAELEIKRRALIATASNSLDADLVAAYGIAVRRLLALDRRIITLAEAGQAALATQMHVLNTGRDAIQAYRQHKP